MSKIMELYEVAEIIKLEAELAECKTELAEITFEQKETRRKHQEDYDALHDAVAERNELRAKLAALEGQQ